MLIACVTIASVFGLTHFLYQKFYVDHKINTLTSHGRALALAYEQEPESFPEQLRWANDSLDWNVIFTDNPMLLSGSLPFEMPMTENLISFEERQTLLLGQELVIIRKHEKFAQDILAVVIPLLEQEQLTGAIFLYTPLSAVYEPFRPLRIILIVCSLLLLGFIVYVARKMTHYLVQPIKKMIDAAGKMAAGDFTERLSLEQEDELGQLAHSFNQMASSLQQVEQNRREFLANVAHELRTPISYMKGFNEAFEEGLVDADKYVAVMKKETVRLERLVHDLLDLAQLEGDSYPMNPSPIPFSQLIMDVTDRFEMKLKSKKLSFELDLDDTIIVYGDPDRLEQVITNLLQNAWTYSEPHKRIGIRLFADKQAVLEIQDEGVGIPAEDIPRVFDRFYRVNKARSRADGGLGIGLAIVYQIIKKHGGDITIQSLLGQGTTVTIQLPLEE